MTNMTNHMIGLSMWHIVSDALIMRLGNGIVDEFGPLSS